MHNLRATMRELMSTKEVADYLRLKERKIYDLVARSAIPHSRVSGKLLFPRALIAEWVGRGMAGNLIASSRNAPAVIAGSSDPLLEWAVRESRCGLASMTYGSMDGIDRMLSGEACAAAMHIPAENDDMGNASDLNNFYRDRNIGVSKDRLAHLDCVLLHWAKREQGLVIANKNPLKIKALHDLVNDKVRVIIRQSGAGSQLLFLQLLKGAGIAPDNLRYAQPAAQTETDVAAAILDGRADVGLAVRAVAKQFHLDFIPLTTESLDLAILRPSFFDPPMQMLLEFTRKPLFERYAKSLVGYDTSELGKVKWNA